MLSIGIASMGKHAKPTLIRICPSDRSDEEGSVYVLVADWTAEGGRAEFSLPSDHMAVDLLRNTYEPYDVFVSDTEEIHWHVSRVDYGRTEAKFRLVSHALWLRDRLCGDRWILDNCEVR